MAPHQWGSFRMAALIRRGSRLLFKCVWQIPRRPAFLTACFTGCDRIRRDLRHMSGSQQRRPSGCSEEMYGVPENSVCAVTKTGPKPALIWDHNEERNPSEWIFLDSISGSHLAAAAAAPPPIDVHHLVLASHQSLRFFCFAGFLPTPTRSGENPA